MRAARQVRPNSLLTQVWEALVAGDWKQAAAQLEALRPPDQADLFRKLSPAEQDRLLPHLNLEDLADILEALEEEEAAEVAELMARYDLLALPVVDDGDHLLGLITHDDLVEVLEVEPL